MPEDEEVVDLNGEVGVDESDSDEPGTLAWATKMEARYKTNRDA